MSTNQHLQTKIWNLKPNMSLLSFGGANPGYENFLPGARTRAAEVFSSHEGHDISILMPRRAHCLARALGSHDSRTFSSRVLEWNTNWLSGKTVRLVDDSTRTGRYFDYVAQKLEGAGATVSKKVVFPSDWPGLPSDRVSAVVYTMIHETGYPFYVDFPTSAPVTYHSSLASGLWSVPGWSSIDTTNSVHLRNRISSISLFPNAETMGELSNIAEIVKVRAYIRPLGDDRASIRFVPKVTLRPISATALGLATEKLFESFSTPKEFRLRDHLLEDGWFRTCQFVLGVLLLNTLKEALPQHFLYPNKIEVDLKELAPHVPPELRFGVESGIRSLSTGSIREATKLFTGVQTKKATRVFSPEVSSVAKDLSTYASVQGVAGPTGQERVEALGNCSAAFSALYAAQLFEGEKGQYRSGFNVSHLAWIWRDAENPVHLSVALDLLGDMGVCVPVIRRSHSPAVLSRGSVANRHTDIVYRAYRPGENSELGLQIATAANSTENLKERLPNPHFFSGAAMVLLGFSPFLLAPQTSSGAADESSDVRALRTALSQFSELSSGRGFDEFSTIMLRWTQPSGDTSRMRWIREELRRVIYAAETPHPHGSSELPLGRAESGSSLVTYAERRFHEIPLGQGGPDLLSQLFAVGVTANRAGEFFSANTEASKTVDSDTLYLDILNWMHRSQVN